MIDRVYGCEPSSDVRFLIIEGGWHSWLGSAFQAIANVVGPTTDELDASEVIWSFFTEQALSGFGLRRDQP